MRRTGRTGFGYSRKERIVSGKARSEEASNLSFLIKD